MVKFGAPHLWTRAEADKALAELSPFFLECGYTARIVGGVAKRGWSDNDLDLLLTVVPERQRADDFNVEPIIEKLGAMPTDQELESLMFDYRGRTVDLFFEELKPVPPAPGEADVWQVSFKGEEVLNTGKPIEVWKSLYWIDIAGAEGNRAQLEAIIKRHRSEAAAVHGMTLDELVQAGYLEKKGTTFRRRER